MGLPLLVGEEGLTLLGETSLLFSSPPPPSSTDPSAETIPLFSSGGEKEIMCWAQMIEQAAVCHGRRRRWEVRVRRGELREGRGEDREVR